MADFSHSTQRIQPSTSLSLSKRISSNGNGLPAKTVYDDVFGGPPKFGVPTFSPQIDDYSEIFGGFNSSRVSSIPILDLPIVNENDVYSTDVPTSKFDYSEVFGGFNGWDFAVSYQDLLAEPKGGGESSSDDVWTSAERGSLSEGSSEDPASSENNQPFSNEETYQSHDGNNQFNVLYQRTNQISAGDGVNTVPNIAEVNSLPTFTCVVDESFHAEKAERDTLVTEGTKLCSVDSDFGGRLMEEKHLKETMIDQGTRDTVLQISETEILKHKKSLVKEVTSDKPISQQVSESSLKHKKSHSVEAMTDQQVCHKILESDLKLCPEEAMPARPVRRQVSESDLQNKHHTREAMLDQPVHQQNTEIELKHQRNHFKESLSEKPVSHCVTDSECHLNHQSNVMGSGIYRSKSFITVSEINLRTVPSHVPPPSRPPPKVSIKRTASDGSPSFFDVEVDASSSAAAAAMKDAMEKAQARLKSAKESMERKRDGYQNRKKMGLKDDINVKERSEEEAKSKAYKLKEKVQNTLSGEDTEIKGLALEERQKITSLVQPAPQSQVTGQHANAFMKSLKQKNVEEFGSSLEYKERGGGTEEWKRQEQYFELIKADGMTALMEEPRLKEQGENKSSGKDLNMAQEVCFWVEDEIKFTVQMKEDRDNKEKESSQREGNEKKLKESNEQYDVIWKQIHQMAENENNPREVLECDKNEKRECEMEESEKRLQEAFEQEENEKRQKEAHEREENEKRLKEVEELEEIEKQKEEARDRERKDIEKLRKEVWEREENERRLNEACEKEEIENRLNEAREREENEKRLKEAHEKEEIEKRLNEAREREDSKRRLQEALEREEIEKRQNEAREREANEERLKEILEREENDKRQKEARNREENEKRLKEASGRDEDNKGLQEALECEVQKRAYQECMRDEDNMKFSVAQEAIVCVEDYCNSEASKDSPESADSVKKLGVANEVSEQDEDVNISSTRKTSKEELGTENFELGQTSYDPEESGQMRETTTSAIEHKEKAREMKTANQVFTEQVDVTILGAEHVDQSAPERENFQNRKNFASDAMTQGNEKNLEQPQTALQEKDERTTDPYQGASGKDENKNKHIRAEGKSDLLGNAKKMGAAHCTNLVEQKGEKETAGSTSQTEKKEKILGETLQMDEREKNERVQREREREKERLRKLEEDREREREREKDRMAVERATREARERAFADARERAERAAVERATAEVRQRAMAEAREKLEKASAEAREKSIAEKASYEARLRAERAAVERATAEARERAAEKARADKPPLGTRERAERTYSEKFSTTSRDIGMRRCSSFSDLPDSQVQSSDSQIESAQRCKARLERHQRTVERAAKALEEKNMRDHLAQREQSERNRLADTLDAEVKRWSSGKEGNLRALLSTLQYILGPDSGWQPIPLTEVITAVAVKKAYRKATLSVHPDKLQQRGATIQQKYICEKVFDLLKEAWNKFNSEER